MQHMRRMCWDTKLGGVADTRVLCCPSEGPQQIGEMGRDEPSEIHQRQIHGPAPGQKNPQEPN